MCPGDQPKHPCDTPNFFGCAVNHVPESYTAFLSTHMLNAFTLSPSVEVMFFCRHLAVVQPPNRNKYNHSVQPPAFVHSVFYVFYEQNQNSMSNKTQGKHHSSELIIRWFSVQVRAAPIFSHVTIFVTWLFHSTCRSPRLLKCLPERRPSVGR